MELIGWNPYNKDANAVVPSQKMSFYNCVPIIRADMGSGWSGSFGIILLDRSVTDADTVRHEFGHVPQLMMLGIFRYGFCIGIPSFKNWYKKTSIIKHLGMLVLIILVGFQEAIQMRIISEH